MTYPVRYSEYGTPALDIPTLKDCGCTTTVWKDGSGVEIDYCPLHAAAPHLLEACKAITHASHGAMLPGPVYLSIAEVDALKAAITAAEGV